MTPLLDSMWLKTSGYVVADCRYHFVSRAPVLFEIRAAEWLTPRGTCLCCFWSLCCLPIYLPPAPLAHLAHSINFNFRTKVRAK